MAGPVANALEYRTSPQPAGVERLIVAIADAQRGLITLKQLLGLELSQSAIGRRVRVGRLIRIHQGVFAVGRMQLDARARWLAATLACAPGALLSHLSAAGLWRIWPEHRSRPHVTMPGNGRLGHEGIAMHRMRRMHPDDAHILDGIPVTSIELTSLHLATMLGRRSLERAVIKAARRREFTVEAAMALCERSHGRPGVNAFRRIVARDLVAELRALSELELRFVEVLRHHDIRLPEINQDVESFIVDAAWHEERLVVELDGYEFHKLPRDLRRDNERARRLVLSGYRVVRFVWQDVVGDPGGVAANVIELLGTPNPSRPRPGC